MGNSHQAKRYLSSVSAPIYPIKRSAPIYPIKRAERVLKGQKGYFSAPLDSFKPFGLFWTLLTRNKFVVRRVPSATLGKNGDDG